MNIYKEIKRLINYGIDKKLITKEDKIFVRNKILDILNLDEFIDIDIKDECLTYPEDALDNILDFAYENGVLKENSTIYRDLLDTKIMASFLSKPSIVIKEFYENYNISPKHATDKYYNMSIASNYIRKKRIDKNKNWKANSSFGKLDITINLSKPEKDPKIIAKGKNLKPSSYPKCVLCRENEGYKGRINHPARQTLRLIPINLCGEEWFMQYSPYVYYNEHSIIFKGTHEPMNINISTFKKLLDFVSKFPHYFVGSNADLPIVGGSILSHDHFQAGRYEFPMEKAPIERNITIKGFEDIDIGIVKWPMSVIRLRSENRKKLSKLSYHILKTWKSYNNEKVNIISHTNKTPHNTITPIARFKNNKYEMDLVLRNNRTNKLHPLGIFHPHSNLHHIKKENIGLIEVMGMAILPPRLKNELAIMKECLLGEKDINNYKSMLPHLDWFNYLKNKYTGLNVDYNEILREEIGIIYENILLDCGVFKQDTAGFKAFEGFINKCSNY
ncbi:MAG: UDP-glucose--hexose-1-phosphate uridylyltransferase [Firmicutes bacterium]|nr:UDP-glucose--hexose-1-phosphate uridylyltransferase [Bacillota bacterium]